MNPGNMLGALDFIRRKPEVVGSVGRYFKNRLSYALVNGRNGYRAGPPEQVTVMVTDICNLGVEAPKWRQK